MKKVLCILTALFAISWASAQTSGSSDQSSDQGAQKMQKGTHKKGGAGTLTGCLSGPNDEGAYVLTHGSRKVEVGGNDELSKHVGHTVKLHGTWAKASDLGEKEASEASEKSEKGEAKEKSEKGEAKEGQQEKHFKVASIDHISDSCQAGGKMGGKMGGHHHKMGGTSGGAEPSPSPSPSPQP